MKGKSWKPSAASTAALAAALWLSLAAPGGWAEKKKSKVVPQAIVAGSVFHENGFLLRGARVVVWSAEHPKDKKETTTDLQGEFAVRVPAGKARYNVEVSAEGFTPERKAVEIAGDERVDLTFRLVPAPK